MGNLSRQAAAAATCAALFSQKSHQLFKLRITGPAEQGSALPFLTYEASGHQRRKMMAERGGRNSQSFLNVTHGQSFRPGFHQFTVNSQSRHVSQFPESSRRILYVHAITKSIFPE